MDCQSAIEEPEDAESDWQAGKGVKWSLAKWPAGKEESQIAAQPALSRTADSVIPLRFGRFAGTPYPHTPEQRWPFDEGRI